MVRPGFIERGRGEGGQGERVTGTGVMPSMAFKELLNGEERGGGGETDVVKFLSAEEQTRSFGGTTRGRFLAWARRRASVGVAWC
jgi:hypothetical protein